MISRKPCVHPAIRDFRDRKNEILTCCKFSIHHELLKFCLVVHALLRASSEKILIGVKKLSQIACTIRLQYRLTEGS